jgi:DNA processing protein
MDAVDRQLALSRAPGLIAQQLAVVGSHAEPTFHTLAASSAVCGRASWSRLLGEQRRWVFSLPGSIDNPLARGCQALIRSGAKLVESADDILHKLRFVSRKQNVTKRAEHRTAAAANAARLDKDYKILLDALGFEPASLDILVARTGLPSQSVASMLLFLEFQDVVG